MCAGDGILAGSQRRRDNAAMGAAVHRDTEHRAIGALALDLGFGLAMLAVIGAAVVAVSVGRGARAVALWAVGWGGDSRLARAIDRWLAEVGSSRNRSEQRGHPCNPIWPQSIRWIAAYLHRAIDKLSEWALPECRHHGGRGRTGARGDVVRSMLAVGVLLPAGNPATGTPQLDDRLGCCGDIRDLPEALACTCFDSMFCCSGLARGDVVAYLASLTGRTDDNLARNLVWCNVVRKRCWRFSRHVSATDRPLGRSDGAMATPCPQRLAGACA